MVLVIAATGILNFVVSTNPAGDWMMYMNAAKHYREGIPLYNVPIKQLEYSNMYLYSPAFTFLLVPLSLLPMAVSLSLWYLLKFVLLYRVLRILANYTGFNSLSENKQALLIFATFLFAMRFLLYDFNLGQITLFLMWSMLEAWHQMNRKNLMYAAVLLALGVFIKMLSVIFIPYLIYKKKFKLLGLMFLCIAMIFGIPFLAGRWDYNADLVQQWIGLITPFASSGGSYNASTVVLCDLFSAVPAWYTALQEEFALPVLSVSQLKGVSAFLMLFFGAGFLYISRYNPFQKGSDTRIKIREIVYLLACIPILFPYQHKYSIVLMLPVMFYLLYLWVGGGLNTFGRMAVVLAFILMVLSTDGIIGRELNNITQEYKFVTVGGILLLLGAVFSGDTAVKAENENPIR